MINPLNKHLKGKCYLNKWKILIRIFSHTLNLVFYSYLPCGECIIIGRTRNVNVKSHLWGRIELNLARADCRSHVESYEQDHELITYDHADNIRELSRWRHAISPIPLPHASTWPNFCA